MSEDCGCNKKEPPAGHSTWTRRQALGLTLKLAAGSVLGLGAAALGLSWRPQNVRAGWFYCQWVCLLHDEYFYCEWCWEEWFWDGWGWASIILCVPDSYTLMPWEC